MLMSTFAYKYFRHSAIHYFVSISDTYFQRTDHKHSITRINVQVIEREEHIWKHKILEATEVKIREPILNRRQDTVTTSLQFMTNCYQSHDRP